MEEQRLDLTLFSEKIECLREEISKVIVGQDKAVDLVLTCLLANGHVLLEGVPGVAKTLLARLMARLVDAKFSRVQFTPDLMPSDVLGTNIFNVKNQEFEFHEGPVFADIVLVDEINRLIGTGLDFPQVVEAITHYQNHSNTQLKSKIAEVQSLCTIDLS